MIVYLMTVLHLGVSDYRDNSDDRFYNALCFFNQVFYVLISNFTVSVCEFLLFAEATKQYPPLVVETKGSC